MSHAMTTNAEHLARLRAHYTGASGADMFHPAFKVVAEQIFSSSDRPDLCDV